MKQKSLCLILSLTNLLYCIPPEKSFVHETNPYHLYLWGCYNQYEKKPLIVKECFDAIINNECSIFAYAGYVNYLFATRQYQKIIYLIPKIDCALSDHLETQMILIKTLELAGRQKDAEHKMMTLQTNFKTHPEVTYGCALVYLKNNQAQKALEIINHYVESTTEKPMHFIFHYLKAQAYFAENNRDEARKAIAKCLELNPSFDQGWLLSGLMHELAGNLNEAISEYKSFLQLVGHNNQVEQQIMTLMMKQQQQQPSAQTTITKLFKEALMLFQQENYSPALKRIDHCLNLDQNYHSARLLKLEILCALQQSAQAVELLENWINQTPKEDRWYRAAHLLYQANLEKEMILDLFKRLEKKNNHNLLPLLYLADMYLKNKEFEQAMLYLKKALAVSKNKQLKAKIMYQLAILYVNTKDYDTLAQLIEHSISLKHDFAPLYNISAYYYATKGKNYIKAQSLLDNALKQDNKNPHYLDTQALIWYKQGDLSKARSLLVNLTKQEPHDFYIHKHLSKLLFKEGNQQQARVHLEKALACTCSQEQKLKYSNLLNTWSTQRSL